MSEPSTAVFHGRTRLNRLATFAAATRPPFLTASVLPVLAATALAHALSDGNISPLLAALAVIGIALIHSGANVINDYFDTLSGTDGRNTERIFPFSGGSRFIQNGVLTLAETRRLGLALLGGGGIIGLALVSIAGPLLLLIGVIGALTAFFYSAPPCLACRGLGDIAVATAFGVLPVIGTCLLLTGAIPVEAWWLGGIIGCFVAAILWVNSIPDISADKASGKLTIPVRIGHRAAALAHPLWFATGFLLLAFSPLPGKLWVLPGLLPVLAASLAAWRMKLDAAMPLTIVSHAAVCVLLILALVLSHPA